MKRITLLCGLAIIALFVLRNTSFSQVMAGKSAQAQAPSASPVRPEVMPYPTCAKPPMAWPMGGYGCCCCPHGGPMAGCMGPGPMMGMGAKGMHGMEMGGGMMGGMGMGGMGMEMMNDPKMQAKMLTLRAKMMKEMAEIMEERAREIESGK